MRKVWKIFEIREISVTDQWDGFDHSSHIMVDAFDSEEFESEFLAEQFLNDFFNSFSDKKDIQFTVQSIITNPKTEQ